MDSPVARASWMVTEGFELDPSRGIESGALVPRASGEMARD